MFILTNIPFWAHSWHLSQGNFLKKEEKTAFRKQLSLVTFFHSQEIKAKRPDMSIKSFFRLIRGAGSRQDRISVFIGTNIYPNEDLLFPYYPTLSTLAGLDSKAIGNMPKSSH